MRRKIGKIAGYLVMALVVLAILAYVARDAVRDVFIHAVSAQVSKSLHGSLEVSTLRGTLINSLALNDVTLRDANGDTVGYIASIRLAYDLSALLRKRLIIKAVDIVEPQLNLKQMADGSLNISRVFPPSSQEEPDNPTPPALPLAVSLERLQLYDGQMTLNLPAIPGVQTISDLNLHLRGEITPERLRIAVRRLTAQAAPAEVRLDNLQGAFVQAAQHRQLDHVVLEMGQTRITMDGTLPGGGEAASLSVQVQPFDVAAIGRVLQDDAFRGLVHGHLAVEGLPAALRVQARLMAKEGSVALESEINTASAPFQYHGVLDIDHLNIGSLIHRETWQSDLNMRAALNGQGQSVDQLQGQLKITVEKSRLGPIDLRPSHIELEANRRRIRIHQLNLDTSVAKMTAGGTVDLAGDSDMVYDLSANLAPLQPFLHIKPLMGSVRLKGRASGTAAALTAQGTLQADKVGIHQHRLHNLTLRYAGSELTTHPRVKAEINAHQLRVGAFPLDRLSLQASYDNATHQLGFTADAAHASSRHGSLQGTVALIDGGQKVVLNQLTLQLDERQWQAPEPIRVALGLGRIDFQHVRLAHAEESIALTGAVDGQALQDIKLRVDQLDLAFLRHLLSLPDIGLGRTSLNLHLAGTLTDPILTSDVILQPDRRQPRPFERIHMTLVYAKQQLKSTTQLLQASQDRLRVEVQLPVNMALTPLTLEQRLPTTSQPVALRLVLNRPNLEALTSLWPAFPLESGTLEGKLALEGTYHSFHLDSHLHLHQLGISESVAGLRGSVQLQAKMTTAASYTELIRRVQRGDVDLRLSTIEVKAPRLEGRLAGHDPSDAPIRIDGLRLQADGAWGKHGAEATLQALHLRAQGFDMPPLNLDLAGRLTPKQAEIIRLHARLPHSSLRGNGTLRLATQDVTFNLEIPRLNLTELTPGLPATLPSHVQGNLKLQGRLDAPTLLASFQYAGAEVKADLAAQFKTPQPQYRAIVQISGVDIERVLPGLQGKAQAKLEIQGSGFGPSERAANLELQLDAPGFSLAPGLSTRLKAHLADNTVHLETLRLHSEPATLEAQGSLTAMREVNLEYSLKLGDLASLQDRLGVTVRASGGVSGELRGPLDALRARGNLTLDNWAYTTWQGKSIAATISATDLTHQPQATLSAEIRDLYGPGLPESSLQLDGAYAPGNGTFALNVTKGLYAQTGLNGTATLHDAIHVTLDRLRVQRQTIGWQNAAPVELTRDQQGALHLPLLHLQNGKQELRVQGTLKPGGEVMADVHLHQGHVLPHVQLFAPGLDIPDGQFSLDAAVRGQLSQPQIDATLSLAGLQWREQLLGELKAQTKLTGKMLWTDLQWHNQSNDLLSVRGSWGLGDDGALDMKVQAPGMDMARLAPFSRGILQSAGTLQLDLHVTGNLQNPKPQGTITWRNGVLQLPATGEPYRDIQAQLVLNGSRVTIEQLDIGSRSGPLRLTGWMTHQGISPRQLEVSVQAHKFTAMHTAAIQAMVTSDIALRGSFQDLLVTGKITIPRARIRLDKDLGGGPADVNLDELTIERMYGAGLSTTSDSPDNRAAEERPVPLSFLRTDLNIEVPRNVWAQGPGTAIELRGKLRVTKALQHPFVIAGDIETVRGFASFYGKKFILQEGRVSFTGSEDPTPFLDVVATHTVSGHEVSIQVAGKASESALQLSSTPELDQTDIVSLLVVGKTTSRLTNSEQSSLAKQGQAIAGGLVAQQLEKTLGKTLGLDTIEVESGDSLGAGSIRAGRYVTQDLYLSYRREFGERGGNSVGVEYSLTPRLKVKGSSGDLGDSAIDVLWRLDY